MSKIFQYFVIIQVLLVCQKIPHKCSQTKHSYKTSCFERSCPKGRYRPWIVSSGNALADIFTKPLLPNRFAKLEENKALVICSSNYLCLYDHQDSSIYCSHFLRIMPYIWNSSSLSLKLRYYCYYILWLIYLFSGCFYWSWSSKPLLMADYQCPAIDWPLPKVESPLPK